MPIVNLAPAFRQQFFDNNGNPLSGGLISTNVAGTTTAQITYADSTGLVPNTNPVVLDSSGTASIWLIPNVGYKFIVKNSAAVVLETIDNVISSPSAVTNSGLIVLTAAFASIGLTTNSSLFILRDVTGGGTVLATVDNVATNVVLSGAAGSAVFVVGVPAAGQIGLQWTGGFFQARGNGGTVGHNLQWLQLLVQ
jgi:hypothetical protein